MIPEAPFFTAVAAVSMTLAGFAGLLVALRSERMSASLTFVTVGG